MRLFVFQNQTTITDRVGIQKSATGLIVHVGKLLCNIDCKGMKEGDSMMVVYSPISNRLLPLYNYRELLQIYGLKASESSTIFKVAPIVQVDIVQDEPFVKVFLSKKQFELDGDLDSSDAVFDSISEMHPLDIAFSYETKITYQLVGDKIFFNVNLKRNARTTPVYFNYGAQSVMLDEPYTKLVFDYIPGENVYLGDKHSHYIGREVLVNV